MYEEASRLLRQKKYPEAIESYNKVLAKDTLNGFSSSALGALYQKSRIEFLTGEYDEAFRSFNSIEKHAGSSFPDSLHSSMVLSRARMYAELGRFDRAATVMGGLRQPGPFQRLSQARLWLKGGDFRQASRLFRELAATDDPAVRIMALSGLFDCSLYHPELGLDTPDHYGEKIAAVSGKVMSLQAPAEVKIEALRVAARSLVQLEKHRRNASFFLFRALTIAEGANLPHLVKILQFESNAVIVQKPDVYREVIEYFTQKNMPYASMAAYYMLGSSPELKDEDRISALKKGLDTAQYYGVPSTAVDAVKMEKKAVGMLDDLLIAGSRYFELFEVSEEAKLLDQERDLHAGIQAFQLPAGNEALRNEIVRLIQDISGLQQRKIVMTEDGSGFEIAPAADAAISRKRGHLIELVAEAAKLDKALAATLQPTPVTLRTVQKSLRPEQALIRLFIRDSLSTGLLISNREMRIVSCPVSGALLRSELEGLRRTLSGSGASSLQRLEGDPHRLWLTASLLDPMHDLLSGYRQLVFVTDIPVPFQLLGRPQMLGRGKKVSYLSSSNEVVSNVGQVNDRKAAPGVVFIDAMSSDEARIHKMMHPADRVFLLWKPMTAGEIDELKKMVGAGVANDASGSGISHIFGTGNASVPDDRELYLSSYGID